LVGMASYALAIAAIYFVLRALGLAVLVPDP
jgi:hypothetical protein